MHRLVQIGAALLLAVLVLFPILILGTSTGARWTLQIAGAYLPIEARGVSGTLWRGLALQDLRYGDEGLRLRAEQLAFTPRWRCALQSILCIDRLEAQRLVLQLPAASDEATAPPQELPLAGLPRIDIAALHIDELELLRGEETQRFRQLALRGELGPRRVVLSHLAFEHDLGAVSAGARLRRGGQWTLEAELALADSAQRGAALSLPRDLALQASGDLRTLQASLESSSGPPVALQVEAALDSESATVRAEGTLSGLDALLPALAEQPWTQLSGPLRFTGSASADAQRLELEQALAGYAPEPLPLFINLRGEAGAWTLAEARLGERAGPRLRALGELGRLEALAPRLQLVLLDFAPPAAAGLPVRGVTGTVGLGFDVSDPLQRWTLRSQRLQVAESESRWALSLDLAADGETLFPLGSARGQRNGVPFSYDRAADGDGRARLVLPEGLQLGDYVLSEANLAVLPGEPLAAELALRGDVEGTLALEVRRTAAGADLRLQPLTLVILGETISSANVVSGRWDQAARSLQLDALCLRWRDNRACGDNMQLGESGALALDLVVDERYRGEAAEKPFTLRALGRGQLALTWDTAGLADADLDVDFSELSLDPYASAGTAAPIRWEQAGGRLRWSREALALELALDSESVGDAALALVERGGALDGRLDIAALDLGALNDLLPEWSLTGGKLSSELRIAGNRAQPELFGSLLVDGLSARLPGVDTALSEARLAIDARGRRLALQGEAQFGGAPLRLEGQCCDEGALVATLSGERNRVTLPVGLDATVTPALDIRVDPQNLTVGGLLTVHDGVFAHSGPLNGGVALSDDVVRIDLPPQPKQRFTLNAQLRTLIEPGFTLRSRQLLATLAGDLRLDLRPEQPPALFGNLQVLGGELRALGQALRLTEGTVAFVGDPMNPELALSAEREIRAERLRVGFRVRGSLEEPTLELFSDPQRSERDTLSYLLRGRGPDVGASADSTAMALSLGASAINQTGLLSAFNEIPGLSGVTLGAEGSDEDMAATISAYVGDRLYLSYGLGIYEPVNALTARLYLRSRLWLEVVSRLENSLDLYYRFDRN